MKQICTSILIGVFVMLPSITQAASPEERLAELRTELISLIRELQIVIAEQQGTLLTEEREGREYRSITDRGIEAIYDIERGEPFRDGEENDFLDDDHEAFWTVVERVIPATWLRAHIGEFVIYDSRRDDTVAHVEPLYTDDVDTWRLSLNVAEVDPGDRDELYDALVHEFGHIISLNDGEIDTDVDQFECDTFYLPEGCLKEKSYLFDFIQRFWTPELIDLSDDAALSNDPEEAVEDYYKDNKDQFVTEYAATNPAEDWAETFVDYLLYEKPTGLDVKEQKNLWFYNQPELVRLANRILRNL